MQFPETDLGSVEVAFSVTPAAPEQDPPVFGARTELKLIS